MTRIICILGNSWLVPVYLMLLIPFTSIQANERPLAVMGPVTQVGPIENTEKQILFNRLRELLLEKYRLVSHKVIEKIKDRGYENIDIENCRSSTCVNTILDFLEELEQRFQTREYFQLELLRIGFVTKLTLKRSDLRYPEIIQQMETGTCENCKLHQLVQDLEEVTLELLSALQMSSPKFDDTVKKGTQKKPEIQEKKSVSEQKEIKPTKPVEVLKENQFPLQQEPIEAFSPEPVEAFKTPFDPYEVAREKYNVLLAPQLLDISYSLQIFRIGLHVLVQVEISESGSIISQQILQSSGSRDFDETAMMGIGSMELGPLPKPLNEYASYKVNLRIQNYQ